MELLHLKDFVGNIAVVTTILQFLSGAIVCKQYVSNRTTGESSPLPFICCVLSCALWLLYGAAKDDGKIILVNFVGIMLMTGYTIVFYTFTLKKTVVIKQCLLIGLVLAFVICYVVYENNQETLLYSLGVMASVFTLLTISAPMSKLLHVCKVKNTECLPFPLILMSFVVSSLWTIYGYIVHDSFLQCVNIIGAGLALTQLSLFLVYPSRPSSPMYHKV